jgi:hypothetical protein
MCNRLCSFTDAWTYFASAREDNYLSLLDITNLGHVAHMEKRLMEFLTLPSLPAGETRTSLSHQVRALLLLSLFRFIYLDLA